MATLVTVKTKIVGIGKSKFGLKVLGLVARFYKINLEAKIVSSTAQLATDTRCCECCHYVDYGACDDYRIGMNGRCVYCDHDKSCHPGRGDLHNGPLSPVRRRS